MNPVRQFLPISLFSILFIAGCDTSEYKTESMLYRETAFKEARPPIQKAKGLFTEEVKQHPQAHLDTLIVIQDSLRDAINIYKRKEIENWDDDELKSMQKDFQSLEPVLVDNALDLLSELVKRTRRLRAQVEEIKTRPHSALERSPDEMVKFLAQRYNKEITDCCLIHLGRTDQLLSANVHQHKDLIVMIRTISEKLEKMIKVSGYGTQLSQEIAALSQQYNRQN